jgi:RimJ/RimL family protein N-acetyltransferase
MIPEVRLREVASGDLPIFFEHQADPVAARMASFPPRDWARFLEHWTKLLADATIVTRTILARDVVAGNIVCFEQDGHHHVGYWIGREHWGRGIATRALAAFVALVPTRPLMARVASHNGGSLRVLQKCGFVLIGTERAPSTTGEPEIEELLLRLE